MDAEIVVPRQFGGHRGVERLHIGKVPEHRAQPDRRLRRDQIRARRDMAFLDKREHRRDDPVAASLGAFAAPVGFTHHYP
jgi:hypothetical protein